MCVCEEGRQKEEGNAYHDIRITLRNVAYISHVED